MRFLIKCIWRIEFFLSVVYSIDSLHWNITSYPVVFGSIVELSCYIGDNRSACTQQLRQWIGGKQFTSLCQNSECIDDTKYQIEDEAPCTYKLHISNFSLTDVNSKYACYYGINSYRRNLQLNNKDFVSVPDIINKTCFTSRRAIDIHVFMKNAYPSPQCYASLVGINKTEFLRVNSAKNGYFYDVELQLGQPWYSCSGHVSIYCHLQKQIFTVMNQYIGSCKDVEATQTPPKQGLSVVESGLVVGLPVFAAIIFGLTYCIKKIARHKHKHNKGSQEEDLFITSCGTQLKTSWKKNKLVVT